jgi:hypothetical protein
MTLLDCIEAFSAFSRQEISGFESYLHYGEVAWQFLPAYHKLAMPFFENYRPPLKSWKYLDQMQFT